MSPEDKLRNLLGEPIPASGTEADTLFTTAALTELLEDNNNNLDRAAYEGWRIKAAHYANLVDVTDGNATRAMSDLLDNADKMVRSYLRSSDGPTEGRTRVGRIIRPPRG